MSGSWILGAYAGYASLQQKTPETEKAFWQGLKDLPSLRGLELPFYQDLHQGDSEAFIATLPCDWDYVVTLLPGTMSALQLNPDFGLASRNEAGREAALQHCERAWQRITEINEHCGREAVLAIEIHSAPTRSSHTNRSDSAALERSLERLREKDWGSCRIVLEHCDALRPGLLPVKGFLDLADEVALAKRVGLPLSLNWGRSVLERRDPGGALEHVKEARDHLAAFFFSGVTVDDPVYGSWQDSHAPLRIFSDQPWEAHGGLLTREAVSETLHELSRDTILGIKVQPAPPFLNVDQRLEFLGQQLLAFQEILARRV